MFDQLKALTVKDYQKWLRKQIGQNGRRIELGDAQHAPVENFVKEVTGLDFKLSAGGEVEVYLGNDRYDFFTEATDLAYFIYEDNENDELASDSIMILKAGRALDVALLVNPALKLVAA